MEDFKNKNLEFDLEKIASYDHPIVDTGYDESLGYILEVNDNSYFYTHGFERNNDRFLLQKLLGI